MALKYYNYGALATGATLPNGDSTVAGSLGASNIANSNGVMTIVADGPSGISKSIEGTTQNTSGTSYVTETLSTPTSVFSGSSFWRMPSPLVGSIGASLAWVGSGTSSVVRAMQLSLLSTEQIRFIDAAGGTLFTSTYTGGFVAGQWYRTDYHLTIGSSATTGRLVGATCLHDSSTALANTSYDSGVAINLGTAALTTVRHGTRSSTGTADENIRVAMGYDPASAYLIGPVSVALGVPAVTLGATTNPQQPGGSNGSQVVSWPAISGAVSYQAYIANTLSPAQGDFVSVASGVTSPYTFAGLSAGPHSYGIKAKAS